MGPLRASLISEGVSPGDRGDGDNRLKPTAQVA